MKRALLHGFLGDPSVWDGIAEGAAIALPGHRGGPPVARSWDENVDLIAAQTAGCEVVIGYSLGARVALGLLARGAVARAILISVNPGIEENARAVNAGDLAHARHGASDRLNDGANDRANEPRDARATRRASDAAWAHRFRTEPLADVLDAWEAQPLFATQSRVSADRIAARRARRLALDPEQLARSLETMGLAEMPDYRETLADRCSLIVGADDAKYVELARALKQRPHVIAGCGHDPLLEQPAALATLLATLLA